MAKPCVITYKGKKYSYAEYIDLMVQGEFDSLVNDGTITIGEKPLTEQVKPKPKAEKVVEKVTIKPTSEKELTDAMEKVFGLKKPIAKRVAKVIAQSAKGLIKAGVFADEKAFWDAFPTISNEDVAEITEAQQQGAKGMYRAAINFINALTNPDLSTPLHEVSHWWLTVLDASSQSGNKEAKRMLDAFEVFAKSGEGQKFWNKNFTGKFNPSNYKFRQELFARSWEKYLYDGVVPPSLKKLFDGFMDFMKEIYKDLTDINIQLSPNMLVLFNGIMGEDMKFDQVPAENLDAAVKDLTAALDALEGLFQEPSNKKEEDEQFSIERLRKAEEQGRNSSGEINALATTLLSRLHERIGGIYGENSQEYISISNAEETFLEDLAKEGDFWVEDADTKFGEYFDNGQEQTVYIEEAKTVKEVTKLNDGSLSNNWIEFLDRVALHNTYFPSTAYTIEGFGRTTDGKFVAILKQPYVVPSPTTPQRIKEYMTKSGFEPLSKYDDSVIGTVEEERSFINKKQGIIVEDLHLKNVFEDDSGNMFVIDPVISLDTPDRGYGGTRTPNESQEDTTLFQEGQSNNAKANVTDKLTMAAEKAVQAGVSKKDFIAKIKYNPQAAQLFDVVSEKEVGKIFDKVANNVPTDAAEQIADAAGNLSSATQSVRRYIARGLSYWDKPAFIQALKEIGEYADRIRHKDVEKVAEEQFQKMVNSADPEAAFASFLAEAYTIVPKTMKSTADAMVFHKILFYYSTQDDVANFKKWNELLSDIGRSQGQFISAMQETATPEAIANRKMEEYAKEKEQALNRETGGTKNKDIVEEAVEAGKATESEATDVANHNKPKAAKAKAKKAAKSKSKSKAIKITAFSTKAAKEAATRFKGKLDKYKDRLKAQGLLQSPFTSTKEMRDELSSMMDDVIEMGARSVEQARATFVAELGGVGIKESDAQEIFDEIWDDTTHGEAVKAQFADYLAGRIEKAAKSQTTAKKGISDPIELLARALISKVSGIIPEATRSRVKTDSKKTSPFAKLAELIKNKEISEKAWVDAMQQVKNTIDARTDMSAEEKTEMKALIEDTVSNFLTKPLPKTLMRQAVKSGMKDMDIAIDEVIKKSLTEQDETGKSLAQKIIEATGLDATSAKEIEDATIFAWNELLAAKKRQRIAKILGVNEDGSPKAIKGRKSKGKPSVVDMLMEAMSHGVLDRTELTDAFAQKFGFVAMTPQQRAKLMQFAQQMRVVKGIEMRNRIAKQLGDYIETLDKYNSRKAMKFLNDVLINSLLTAAQTILINIPVGSVTSVLTQALPSLLVNATASYEFFKVGNVLGQKGVGIKSFQDILGSGFNQLDSIEQVYDPAESGGSLLKYISNNRAEIWKNAKTPLQQAKAAYLIATSYVQYAGNFASAFDSLINHHLGEFSTYQRIWADEASKQQGASHQQILDAVKKRMGYDQATIDEAKSDLDDIIQSLEDAGIDIPKGFKERELKWLIMQKRDQEIAIEGYEAAKNLGMMGKPFGFTGILLEVAQTTNILKYRESNTAAATVMNIIKGMAKMTVMPFARMSTMSANIILRNVPVLGLMNGVFFELKPKIITDVNGKQKRSWEFVRNSNKVIAERAIAQTAMITVGLLLFGAMFRYNDDEDDYELDPDRQIDITLDRAAVTNNFTSQFTDLKYQAVSYRVKKKDGTWGEWHTFKYMTPLIGLGSMLGGMRDRMSYMDSNNQKKVGVKKKMVGNMVSDIYTGMAQQTFAQNLRLIKEAQEGFLAGSKSKESQRNKFYEDILKPYKTALLPLGSNAARDVASILYDITDTPKKQGTTAEKIFLGGHLMFDLIAENNMVDRWGNEVPRDNALEKLAGALTRGYYVDEDRKGLMNDIPYQIIEKRPDMFVPQPWASYNDDAINKSIKDNNVSDDAKIRLEVLVAKSVGNTLREMYLEDKEEVDTYDAVEAHKFMQEAKERGTAKIIKPGYVDVEVMGERGNTYIDRQEIPAYGLYETDPTLYFQIFPEMKSVKIVKE